MRILLFLEILQISLKITFYAAQVLPLQKFVMQTIQDRQQEFQPFPGLPNAAHRNRKGKRLSGKCFYLAKINCTVNIQKTSGVGNKGAAIPSCSIKYLIFSCDAGRRTNPDISRWKLKGQKLLPPAVRMSGLKFKPLRTLPQSGANFY